MDNLLDIAHFMKVKWDLGLEGVIVIGNTIKNELSMDDKVIEEEI